MMTVAGQQIILNFTYESKEPKNSSDNFEEEQNFTFKEVQNFTLIDMKTYHEAVIIKAEQ